MFPEASAFFFVRDTDRLREKVLFFWYSPSYQKAKIFYKQNWCRTTNLRFMQIKRSIWILELDAGLGSFILTFEVLFLCPYLIIYIHSLLVTYSIIKFQRIKISSEKVTNVFVNFVTFPWRNILPEKTFFKMKHLTTLLQQLIKSEIWYRWMPFKFFDIGKRK